MKWTWICLRKDPWLQEGIKYVSDTKNYDKNTQQQKCGSCQIGALKNPTQEEEMEGKKVLQESDPEREQEQQE